MNMMKKSLVYAVIIFLIFTLSSRNKDVENSKESAYVAGWSFTIEDYQMSDSLEDISTTVGYGGTSTSNEVSAEPKPGKKFLLVNMILEKTEGSETIDWKNMKLVDSSGKTYSRLHDSFIEDFGFKRMKGTTLSFGNNQGWIAFEVDGGAEDFVLQYSFNNETVELDLK